MDERSKQAERALTAAELAAVVEHFEGDMPLYLEYAKTCWTQLSVDLSSGDLAARTADRQTLKHLSHNLKTVLRTLGHADVADAASQLESAAAANDPQTAERWFSFADALRHLLASRAPRA